MKKLMILVLFLPLIFACGESKPKVEEKVEETKEVQKTVTTKSMQNFAVIWTADNASEEMIEDNVHAQKNAFSKMMTDGTILNAYNNTLVEGQKSLVFLMQAENKASAVATLNEMPFVQKGVAEYQIFTLGTQWYGSSENTDIVKNTYVTIWENNADLTDEEFAKGIETNVDAQIEAVTTLYKNGQIENVYFDTQNNTDVTDFIMYIRAENEDDAKAIADALPFSTKELVSYKLIHVGFPWAGESLGK